MDRSQQALIDGREVLRRRGRLRSSGGVVQAPFEVLGLPKGVESSRRGAISEGSVAPTPTKRFKMLPPTQLPLIPFLPGRASLLDDTTVFGAVFASDVQANFVGIVVEEAPTVEGSDDVSDGACAGDVGT